jgi:hypothetical protein
MKTRSATFVLLLLLVVAMSPRATPASASAPY